MQLSGGQLSYIYEALGLIKIIIIIINKQIDKQGARDIA